MQRIHQLEAQIVTLQNEIKRKDDDVIYRKVFNAANDAILILNNDVIIDCNDRAVTLFGVNQKRDIKGRSPIDFSPDVQGTESSTTRAMEYIHETLNGIPQTFSWRHKRFDNTLIDTEVSLSKLKLSNGDFVLAVVRDISRFKRSGLIQDTLYNISQAVNNTIDLKELISKIQTLLGRIIDTTNFYIALYDREKDTLSLPYFIDSKDKFEDIPAGKTLSAYVIKSGKSLLARRKKLKELEDQGEIELVGTDSKVWLGVPLKLEHEIIGMIGVQSYTNPHAFSNEDRELLEFVSSQIGLSIQRKQFEDNIKLEKAYFEQLFQNSPEGIAITDGKGNFLRANSEFFRMFGYTSEEIENKNLDILVTPENLMSESQNLTRRMVEGYKIRFESIRKRKNGEEFYVSIWGAPIEIENGVVACCSLYRDISDIKKHEKNLIESRKKAEESDRLKTAFLANMSHEIRTPLNAIIGFSDLLNSPDLTDDLREEYVQVIKTSGNALLHLINDIIDVAKIEAGQLVMSNEEFLVKPVLNEILSFFIQHRVQMDKNDIAINLEIPQSHDDILINTDINRFKQIFTNLINNALKFTYEGTVHFGYQLPEKNAITFFVYDSGIGLTKEEQVLIFKRFRQTDSTIRQGTRGTGLGLTISKNLVNLMGGEIWVESETGKGSTFYFSLPYNSKK
ncbi:MAG TPA: PAS domain S-box protein [Bacteroidales bacterium]|nr:PAS domain S-box protein [Bacteroidales bacterium]